MKHAVLLTCAAGLTIVAACSGEPVRSQASFCTSLGKNKALLVVPMTTPEQVTQMVKRYDDLDKRAPEAIRDEWHELTELIRKAATSDVSTPAQQADLVALAYSTDKSVKAVTAFSKETCGVDFSPGALPPTTVVAGG